MSLATKENGKKWIQTSVAITCMILGYVLMSFFETLGDWFDLEAKITNFLAIEQGIAVLVALGAFTYIIKNEKTSTFLADVYQEAIKVVWPGRIDTNKQTIVIMIGVTLIGFVLGFFDLIASWLLSLIA